MSEKIDKCGINDFLKSIEGIVSAKTVVGEPTKIEDTIIVPLVDISCGAGFGNVLDTKAERVGGGFSTKMSPTAVLIIQNGVTKLVNIKGQDPISKAMDLVPDLINKFSQKEEISEEVMEVAREHLENN